MKTMLILLGATVLGYFYLKSQCDSDPTGSLCTYIAQINATTAKPIHGLNIVTDKPYLEPAPTGNTNWQVRNIWLR